MPLLVVGSGSAQHIGEPAAYIPVALPRRVVTVLAQLLPGPGEDAPIDVDWVAALSVAALATVVSLLTSLATPDFTSGAPADEYQGKHEAPDPRHHVAD